MRRWIVAGAMLWIGGAICVDAAQSRHREPGMASAKCPAAKASASRRKTSKPDPAAAWVGREVRIETVDRGLYLGTLEAVGPDSLVLDISLPTRALRYSLPRSAVANLRPLDP